AAGDDASDPVQGAGNPAPEANQPAITDPVQAMRQQIAAESERIAAVRRLCAGQHPEIEARSIREGWDATKTELEVLRASRPKAPAIHAPAAPAVNQRVLEAACVLSGRLTTPERHCAEQDLEAATRAFGQSIGLQELLLHAAWANG